MPVLFLSTHQDSLTIQKVFEAGADDYISKPIVEPELVARLLNRLQKHYRRQLAQTNVAERFGKNYIIFEKEFKKT